MMVGIFKASTALTSFPFAGGAFSEIYFESTKLWPTGPVASLDIDFLQDWGAAINDAVVTGGASFLTHSRSTTQTGFDESGVLQTAAVDDPVFDHDPGNSDAALGYLSEGAATNEALYSEDTSSWNTAVSIVETVNDAVAPDGATTADKLSDESAAAIGYRRQDITIAADTSPWLYYHYIKKTSGFSNYAGIRLYLSGGTALFNAHIVIDTNNGIVTAAGANVDTYGIIDCGDYWLAWFTCTNASNTSCQVRTSPCWNDDGDVTADAVPTGYNHFWGAGVLNVDRPSSYIKTTTAAATRAKNILTASRAGLSEETVVIQARTGYGAGIFWSHDDGTDQERIYIERNSSDEIHCVVVDGGVTQCDLNLGTVADLTAFKVAFSWAANDFQASLNGGTKVTDTGGTLPTRTTMHYGHDYANLNHCNGHLQRHTHYDSLEDVEALAA